RAPTALTDPVRQARPPRPPGRAFPVWRPGRGGVTGGPAELPSTPPPWRTVFAGHEGPMTFSPMALAVHPAPGAAVAGPPGLLAIEQELATARSGRLVGITLEGEPGIGKTRLLLAAAERAAADGCTVIAVTADEELQGPFLVARSILGSPAAAQAAV